MSQPKQWGLEESWRASQERYDALVEAIGGIVWEIALPEWRFTFVNEQAERILGYPARLWLDDPEFWPNHLHPQDRAAAVQLRATAASRGGIHEFEYRMIAADRRVVWLREMVAVQSDGWPAVMRCVLVDITRQKREEALHTGQMRVLETIASSAPLPGILESIVHLIEPQSDGMLCSILLLNQDLVHVMHGAAPNLPEAYSRAIDWAPIGPKAGSCGTAMFRGKQVIVSDIFEDPLWEDYRGLAAQFGLRACWSTPIISHTGDVLGSFAMYYHEPRSPGAEEIHLINVATHVAAIAIERKRAEAELHRGNSQIREMASKLLTAQEEERRRISRELHDDIVQKVAALAMGMSRVKRRVADADKALADELAGIQQNIFGIAADLRQISHRLHPAVLEHAGLAAALKSFIEEFSRTEGIDVKLTVPDEKDAIPRDSGVCVYRVVQECLRNIAKHSGAKSAEVTLSIAGHDLCLVVRDAGRGFDVGQARGGGLGMISIEERVRLCRGTVEITSQLGLGTTLAARIPLVP